MTTSATNGARAVASSVAQIGELGMFYLDAGGGPPTMVLLHGLSSNANAFSGVIAAGLSPRYRVIAPDMRGRARTSKPASGYSIAQHARDIIGLMDHLELHKVVLGGHSFGGYLAIYIAAHHPERVEKLIVIDSALNSTPRAVELLKPSLDRLTRIAASPAAYLDAIRTAPYMDGVWDDAAEQYFRAELQENPDGTAQSATSSAAIAQVVPAIAAEPWLHWVQEVRHPTLLLNAVDGFGCGNPPIMGEVDAKATARAFRNARYTVVPGNHLTMMFAPGAEAIHREIVQFVESGNGRAGGTS